MYTQPRTRAGARQELRDERCVVRDTASQPLPSASTLAELEQLLHISSKIVNHGLCREICRRRSSGSHLPVKMETEGEPAAVGKGGWVLGPLGP